MMMMMMGCGLKSLPFGRSWRRCMSMRPLLGEAVESETDAMSGSRSSLHKDRQLPIVFACQTRQNGELANQLISELLRETCEQEK